MAINIAMISRRKYLMEAADFLGRLERNERVSFLQQATINQYRGLSQLKEAVETFLSTEELSPEDELVVSPEGILNFPEEDLTEELIFSALSSALNIRKILNRLPQDVMTDDLLARFIQLQPHLFGEMWEQIPKRLRTEPVIHALIEKGALPLGDVPRGYLTREYVLARVPGHPGEVGDVPKGMMDQEMAAALVERNIDLILEVPARCRSEAMLYAWLVGAGRSFRFSPEAERETFDLFPKTMWSQRVVAEALRHGILTQDDRLRDKHLDANGAAWLLVRNPGALSMVPEELLTDQMLGDAVTRHPLVLSGLRAAHLTEPVVFAALTKWAGTPHAGRLADLPRDVFSVRCWEAGAGHLFGLDEIPEEFHDDGMIGSAIARDPRNVILLPDPAGWMNDQGEDIFQSLNDLDWRKRIEQVGIVRVGQHWVDVRDLKKKSLKSGGSYVAFKTGGRLRIFVFDDTGKMVGSLGVRDQKIDAPVGDIPPDHIAEIMQRENIDIEFSEKKS